MIRYEKYKDSGIEWIGEIPEHWEETLLKYTLDDIICGGTPSTNNSNYWTTDNNGIPWVSIADITKSNGNLYKTERKITIDGLKSKNLKIIPKETLLISIFASLGKTTILKIDASVNQAILGLVAYRKLNKAFLKFYLNYIEYFIAYYSSSNTQENLNLNKIKNLPIVIPQKPEQTAIANYLDRKTAEIDELINQKEQLLKLYEEEKTAIINQAVTKGINPDVRFKNSGIDWLDDTSTSLSAGIPEHWEVKKLKYHITKAGSGVTPRGGASVYLLSGIPLLRSQNIHFDGLKLDDVAYISEKINNEMSNSKVFSGDVLLNITGASIGRCFYITDDLGEANVNQHVCIIRPQNNLSSKFLYFVLRSYVGQVQINIEQTGSGREGLNFEDLKSFVIPNLKIEEQTAIVHYIETETTRINTKLEKTKKLIELLKEYKTALISEVVTGKVKVI